MIRICPVVGQIAGAALVDVDGRVIAVVPRGSGAIDWARRLADLIDTHGLTDVPDTPAELA
jgi:hypothetical protein